jgi:hypothetical protein
MALGLEATSMWEQREDTLWLREDYWPPKRERENLGRPPSLTPAEQERAIMLIRQGMPLWKVAELFDTSYEVVRRLAKRQGVELGVQRFMVVDNSDFSANRLTARETRLILAFQGVLMLPHFKQRGFVWRFMCSCSCSWPAFSSLWRCFGVFAGFLFSLPTHEEGPSAPCSTAC